jgi:Putative lumazine-binding
MQMKSIKHLRKLVNPFSSETVVISFLIRLTALSIFMAGSKLATAGPLEDALGAYVEGLRTGDAKTLNKLFFNDGQFCLNRGTEIICSSFAKAIPSWVVVPDRKASGKITSKEVIEESMARVTYELDFNGDSYIDYLLLYKKNGQWVVVAKTTYLRK